MKFFCKSVEDQPGRAYTHEHARTSCTPRHRPSSLYSSPALPVYGALPSHQSGVPLFLLLNHRHLLLLPDRYPQICSTVAPPPSPLAGWLAGWQEEALRRAVSYHLLMFLLRFRPECLKLLRLASRLRESAQLVFSLRAPVATQGLLIRARSSQVSARTVFRAASVSVTRNPMRKCDRER